MTLYDKIDQARRDMAAAAWCASNDEARIDAVLSWAQTLAALYAALDPVQPAPRPQGLALAGRTKDGSYVFTPSGEAQPYVHKGKVVRRRLSRKAFAADYYRVDGEFPEVEHVEVNPAYTGNDLIFTVQA